MFRYLYVHILGLNYFGIDTSPKMIAEAKSFTKSDRFNVFDGVNIPYPDNSFDAVIAVMCISSIANKIEPIEKEMLRVVKNECPILILDYGYFCVCYK